MFRFWAWLKILRDNAVILYYAWRHPLTPRYVKGILTALFIYLISPIDILPDYLPLVGIADDAALVTGAMLYLTQLLPAPVLAESKRQSEKWGRRLPYIFGMIAVAAVAWIALVIAIFRKVFFE
ncbi:YkvA family protein [Sporomusa sp.]|uniref:YkvA family protein n=1 Tax=Sporomusa sp. TaxID=2078658 RepID=UPI002CF59075|nr:YkvA family protein [Sporomusa sp.]HWR44499.1 YkvA family protein [Sporomusa sp.]